MKKHYKLLIVKAKRDYRDLHRGRPPGFILKEDTNPLTLEGNLCTYFLSLILQQNSYGVFPALES
jgi:hypothetical protein